MINFQKPLWICTLAFIGLLVYSVVTDTDVNISGFLLVLIWILTAHQFNKRAMDFYYPTQRKPDSLVMYLLSYQRLVLQYVANALKYVCVVFIIYTLLKSFDEHKLEPTAESIPALLHIFFGPLFFVVVFVFILLYYSFISGQLDNDENASLIEVSKYPIINWLVLFLMVICLTLYPSIIIDKYFVAKIKNPAEHYYYKICRRVTSTLSHENLFNCAKEFKDFGLVLSVGLAVITVYAILIGLAEGQKIKTQTKNR
jgi:hypothetical protein